MHHSKRRAIRPTPPSYRRRPIRKTDILSSQRGEMGPAVRQLPANRTCRRDLSLELAPVRLRASKSARRTAAAVEFCADRSGKARKCATLPNSPSAIESTPPEARQDRQGGFVEATWAQRVTRSQCRADSSARSGRSRIGRMRDAGTHRSSGCALRNSSRCSRTPCMAGSSV